VCWGWDTGRPVWVVVVVVAGQCLAPNALRRPPLPPDRAPPTQTDCRLFSLVGCKLLLLLGWWAGEVCPLAACICLLVIRRRRGRRANRRCLYQDGRVGGGKGKGVAAVWWRCRRVSATPAPRAVADAGPRLLTTVRRPPPPARSAQTPAVWSRRPGGPPVSWLGKVGWIFSLNSRLFSSL
jgi:hypothetical protein